MSFSVNSRAEAANMAFAQNCGVGFGVNCESRDSRRKHPRADNTIWLLVPIGAAVKGA